MNYEFFSKMINDDNGKWYYYRGFATKKEVETRMEQIEKALGYDNVEFLIIKGTSLNYARGASRYPFIIQDVKEKNKMNLMNFMNRHRSKYKRDPDGYHTAVDDYIDYKVKVTKEKAREQRDNRDDEREKSECCNSEIYAGLSDGKFVGTCRKCGKIVRPRK